MQEQIDELALLLEEESERQQERMQQWFDAQEENDNTVDIEKELVGLESEVDKFAEQTEIDATLKLMMTHIEKMTSMVDDIQ